MKRVALTTLGCKANWADGDSLSSACERVGFTVVPFDDDAEAYIVNTCAVTRVAELESRRILRRAMRKNPAAAVIAAGCAGKVGQGAMSRIVGDDAVFGPSDRERLVEHLCERLGHSPSQLFDKAASAQSRARAFLKIQDGCDRACAYCIVPIARGRSGSMPAAEVIERCLKLSGHHREIVLTGIDIEQYHDTVSQIGLIELLERLLPVRDLSRLRITSIRPNIVNDRLVAILNSGRVCRHIHLSIQSLSDNVLGRMGRKYTSDDVIRAASLLSERVPDIAITGDVIAGFPGEDEDDHKKTVEIISKLPLAGLHVFPYSERPGTKAQKMKGHLPQRERKRRAAELREVGRLARQKFLSKLLGKTLEVIVVSRTANENGLVSAFSDNAVSVLLPSGIVPYRELGGVCVTLVNDLEVRGVWKSTQKTRPC